MLKRNNESYGTIKSGNCEIDLCRYKAKRAANKADFRLVKKLGKRKVLVTIKNAPNP